MSNLPSNYLEPKHDRIPDELKALDQWIIWAAVPREGKPKPAKVPLQLSGWGASSVNPKHWVSFDRAKAAYDAAVARGYIDYHEKDKPTIQVPIGGIGFVFTDKHPDQNGYVYVGVDFDNISSLDDVAQARVKGWIKKFSSYTERSVSGNGYHVIVKAFPVGAGLKKNDVEVYSTARYFAFTGRWLQGYETIQPADLEVRGLLAEMQVQAGGVTPFGSVPFSSQHMSFAERMEATTTVADSLGAGIDSNNWFDDLGDDDKLEAIRAAAKSIPGAELAIGQEEGMFGWLRLARCIAQVAYKEPHLEAPLYEILDEVSQNAPGYYPEGNVKRFQKLIRDAATPRVDGVTIGSLLGAARKFGADFDKFKYAKVTAAAVIANTPFMLGQRMPLVPGTYQPDQCLRLFLEHVFYAEDGLIEKCWVRVMDNGVIKTYNYKQLEEAFANYHITITTMDGRSGKLKSSQSSAVKFYKEHSQRRNAKVVFEPGAIEQGGTYNLWQGFPHSRDPRRNLMALFIEHLWHNIAKKRKHVFWYTVKWMAHAVQKPHEKMQVALILHGKEMGTGKSIIGEVMRGLFPPAHAQKAELPDVTGNFNDHTLLWSFMDMDETYLDRENERALRRLLTSATRRIEIKGGAVTHVPNCLHIMITNNAEVPVPVGDTDRRYACFEPGTRNIQDREFFGKIKDGLNQGGYGQLLDYLLNIDLTGWNPEHIPDTEERQKLKDMSADAITQWLMDRLEDDTRSIPEKPEAIKADFYEWFEHRGLGKKPGPREVCNRMTKIFGESKVTRDGKKLIRKYDVDDAETKLNRYRGKAA
jgi:hypothetical protein